MSNKTHSILLALVLAVSSCASYKASTLNTLSSETIRSRPFPFVGEDKKISIIAKQFDSTDCKRYLDRDVISKGYQPIQLYIQNNSDDEYAFSLDRVSLPCATPEEVARKVHTSTVGRAVGYGTGALFLWPLAIPAIVDGIKSAEANEALDFDFASKAAKDQVIFPHSHFNKLLFVPFPAYQSTFTLKLVNLNSGKTETFKVLSKCTDLATAEDPKTFQTLLSKSQVLCSEIMTSLESVTP